MITRAFRVSFVSFAVVLALSGCRAPITLDEIINRNTEAMGGRPALEGIQSVAVALNIVDPGFAVEANYRAVRPGRMRIDVVADGRHVYTEAFDGQRAWQWKGEGTEIVAESPKATAALRHGVELPGHLYALHEMQSRGHRLELIGREQIDGIAYFALRITLNDSYVTTVYIDPASWVITRRRDVRPLHVDLDPTPTTIEQHMTDFRRVAGVLFSYRNTETDLKTGKVLETTTVRSVTVNPVIDTEIFTTL